LQALVKTKRGPGNVSIREIPVPTPGDDEVLLEVRAAGICGTDIHIMHDTFRSTPPVVLGHEFSGVVSRVGSKASSFKPGDRVICESSLRFCGRCLYCRTGCYNLCPNRKIAGINANGAFAKYVAVPERALLPLPDSIDFVEGALFEPFAVAVLGVSRLTGVMAGDVVLVSGPGPLGLLAAQVAKAEGATVVLSGLECDKGRLAVGQTLGIDHLVNVEKEDLDGLIKSLSDGYGADVVVECAGHPSSVSTCLELVRRGGKYCQIALFGKPAPVDLDRITLKQLSVTGPLAQYWPAWYQGLRLVVGKKVRLRELVSHELPLENWREGFELHEKNEGLKKVLIPA